MNTELSNLQENIQEVKISRSDKSESSLDIKDEDSPALKKEIRSLKVQNRKLDIERKKERWRSCCGNDINRHFLKYIIQVSFGASLVVFSMIQIVREEEMNRDIYFSLLSSTIAWFMPSPTMNKD